LESAVGCRWSFEEMREVQETLQNKELAVLLQSLNVHRRPEFRTPMVLVEEALP
jgi:hypothetical protein